MFTKILTDVERKRIQSHLKHDGEREICLRSTANCAKVVMLILSMDLQLLEGLLRTFSKTTLKGQRMI
jgi:hypothetical protein